MAVHSNLTGAAAVHQAAYVQSTDPGTVGPLKFWVDTSTTPYTLKLRNTGNSGWDTVRASDVINAIAGSGLTGGSGAALNVNVDGATIEIVSNTVRNKDGGITNAKLGSDVKVGSLAAAKTNVKTDVIAALNETFLRIAGIAAPDGALILGDDFGPTRRGPLRYPGAVAAPLGTYGELGPKGLLTFVDPNNRIQVGSNGRMIATGVDTLFTSPVSSLNDTLKRRPGTMVYASFLNSDWQIGWAKDTDTATIRGGIRASGGVIQLHNGSAFAPTGITFSSTTEYFVMLVLMDTGVASYIRTASTPWKMLFPLSLRDSSGNNRTSPVKWNITHNGTLTFAVYEPVVPLDGKWSRQLGNTSDSQMRPSVGRAGSWSSGDGILGCDWTMASGQVARQRIRKSDSTHYVELVADQAAGRVLLVEQNGASQSIIAGVRNTITEGSSPDGGTFNLSLAVDGGTAQTLTGVAWNVAQATLQTALQGLSNVGSGNIAVSRAGAAGAYVWTITPTGTLIGHDFLITITANNLTVGGSPGGTLTVSNANYTMAAGSIFRFEMRAEGTDIRVIAGPGTLTLINGTSSLNSSTGNWELTATATATPSRLAAYELWGPTAIPRAGGVRPLHIWCIGDSKTVGQTLDDAAVGWTSQGYPWYLMELLEQSRGAGAYERPVRTATGGWSILDEAGAILGHISTALAEAVPDAILFNLVTNDRTFQVRAPGAFETDFKAAYGYCMDQLNAAIPKARILVTKPWAPGYYYDRIEQAYQLAQSGAPTGGTFTVTVATESVYSLKQTGSPTGGNFDIAISVDGGATQTALAVPYNVAAATLQSTLQGLSNIGVGNLLVGLTTNVPGGINNLWDLTTAGALLGHSLAITITPHFTGGTSPAVAVNTAYAGGLATTPSLAWNVGAAALRQALEALLPVGAGNVTVERSGVAGTYTWTVTPTRRLALHNVAVSVAASLSGGVSPTLNNTPAFVTRSQDSFDLLASWIDDVIAERQWCSVGVDERLLYKVPDGNGHYKYLSTLDDLHPVHSGYMLFARAAHEAVLRWFPAVMPV